jgi:hypothetical protein
MSIQDKNNYCLVSILSDIFLGYGITKSQDEIANNLTPAKYGFRADDKKIKSFVNSLGLKYDFYWWNETPLNEPFDLIEEITDNWGFIGMGNHAYRVMALKDNDEIIVKNPKDDSFEGFNYFDVMKKLSKKDGGFGLIKKLK